jgi:hypothetical protein
MQKRAPNGDYRSTEDLSNSALYENASEANLVRRTGDLVKTPFGHVMRQIFSRL